MLEAAVTVADGGDLEEIPVEWRRTRCGTEQLDLPLADSREIRREAVEVDVDLAGDRDIVRSRRRRRTTSNRKSADFHGMIDELVEVLRSIRAEAQGAAPALGNVVATRQP